MKLTERKSEKPKEEPWQNELDTKKYLVDVHSDFKQYLGTDFKMAKLSSNQKEYILDMLTVGMISFEITPNPDVGHEIKQLDYSTMNAISILEFNQDNNMIIDRLTEFIKKENEQEKGEKEEEAWYKKMKRRMKAKEDD